MSKTLELFESTDIEVLIAAGNETNAAYQNRTGWNLSRSGNPDDGVVVPRVRFLPLCPLPPSTTTAESLYFTVNGRTIGYNDTATTNATKFLSNFKGQSVEFVPIGGYGEASDYENVDVSGKIALVSRGSSSFPDKQAAAQGCRCDRHRGLQQCLRHAQHAQINDADREYMKAQFAEGRQDPDMRQRRPRAGHARPHPQRLLLLGRHPGPEAEAGDRRCRRQRYSTVIRHRESTTGLMRRYVHGDPQIAGAMAVLSCSICARTIRSIR